VIVAFRTKFAADTKKVAFEAPAGTVTLAGKLKSVEFDEKFTTAPPVGAAEVNEIVPNRDEPTTKSSTEMLASAAGGVTVTESDFSEKLGVASTLTAVGAVTVFPVTGKVALLAPAGIKTEAGQSSAAGLLLSSVTNIPPVGAADCSFTVADPVTPPESES